jgi:hypothetical protein
MNEDNFHFVLNPNLKYIQIYCNLFELSTVRFEE